jgi:hypothetical protein
MGGRPWAAPQPCSLSHGGLVAACKGESTPRSEQHGRGRSTHRCVERRQRVSTTSRVAFRRRSSAASPEWESRCRTRSVRGAGSGGSRPASRRVLPASVRHRRSTPVLRVSHTHGPNPGRCWEGCVLLCFPAGHVTRVKWESSYDTHRCTHVLLPAPCAGPSGQLSSTAARPALLPRPAGRGPAWRGRCLHRCPPATRSTATPLAAPHPSTPRHHTPDWRTSVEGGGRVVGMMASACHGL